MGRVLSLEELRALRDQFRGEGKVFVFTNGCFDIIHRGHVELLAKCRALGDVLAVGVNSDASVKRLKGDRRPVVPEHDRAAVVASLGSVDFVTVFEQDTPEEVIKTLVPDVLVKGSDYELDEIVGRDVVEGAGGRVVRVPLHGDHSTERMLARIARLYRDYMEGRNQ